MTNRRYEFELLLSRAYSDEELDTLFELTAGSVTPSVSNGVPVADADLEASTLADAALQVIQHVESAAPGLRVLAIDADPLIGVSEIAERVGRTYESVRLSIAGARGPGEFPTPEVSRPRGRLWRWSRVAEWYGIEDSPIRDAGPTVQAINGWLALRAVVPSVAPEPQAVSTALAQRLQAA